MRRFVWVDFSEFGGFLNYIDFVQEWIYFGDLWIYPDTFGYIVDTFRYI